MQSIVIDDSSWEKYGFAYITAAARTLVCCIKLSSF